MRESLRLQWVADTFRGKFEEYIDSLINEENEDEPDEQTDS